MVIRDKDERDTARILSQALQALDLDFAYVKAELDLEQHEVSELRNAKLSASDWINICHFLCLPVDFIGLGYNPLEHHRWIYSRWKNGSLKLPYTGSVQKIIFTWKQKESDESKCNSASPTFTKPKLQFRKIKVASQIVFFKIFYRIRSGFKFNLYRMTRAMRNAARP